MNADAKSDGFVVPTTRANNAEVIRTGRRARDSSGKA